MKDSAYMAAGLALALFAAGSAPAQIMPVPADAIAPWLGGGLTSSAPEALILSSDDALALWSDEALTPLPAISTAVALAPAAAAVAPAAAPSAPSSFRPFGGARLIGEDVLRSTTGRANLAIAAQSSSTSSVSNSSVNGTSQTGDIRFSDQSLQNAAGLTVINTNTGNNVAMNASLNVNLVINPSPPQ